MKPRLTIEPEREQGILDAWIDFGCYRVRVRRWKAGDRYWHDAAGNRYGDDGVMVVEDGADPDLAWRPNWALMPEHGRCPIGRRWTPKTKLRPLPYVRRLNELRRAPAGQGSDYLSLRIYAGPSAWERARPLAREQDPGQRAVPLVVLPPGEDPRAFDWSPLRLWRYSAADARALAERWEDLPPRAGDGYRVRLFDEAAPVDDETRDLLAAILLAQGHQMFAVRAMPTEDGLPGILIEYVRGTARHAA